MDCSHLREEFAQATLDVDRTYRAVQECEEKRIELQLESNTAWRRLNDLKDRIIMEALRS